MLWHSDAVRPMYSLSSADIRDVDEKKKRPGGRLFSRVDGEELILPDKVNVGKCITDVYNT